MLIGPTLLLALSLTMNDRPNGEPIGGSLPVAGWRKKTRPAFRSACVNECGNCVPMLSDPKLYPLNPDVKEPLVVGPHVPIQKLEEEGMLVAAYTMFDASTPESVATKTSAPRAVMLM